MTKAGTVAGRFISSRYAPFLAALAAFGLAALLLMVLGGRGGGAGGTGDDESLPGSLTVPAIPDSVRGSVPDVWGQPRNDPSGSGVWGPDICAPMDTLWRIHTGMEFFAAPALCGETIFFGGNDGVFRAVDATDGSLVWSYATSCGLNGEPAVSNDAVYFCGQDGYVYALGRASGSLIWKAGLGYHIFASAGILCDTILVTGNSAGSIAALSVSTGDVLWHSSPGGVVLGPALADTLAVFTSEDGVVCAYGARGTEVWRRDFSAQASAPSISGASVFVGFADGVIRRMDLSTGTVTWETDLVQQTVRTVISRPVAADGRIFAGTCDSRVVCLSEGDGGLLWETEVGNWVQVPPAVGDSALYVCSDDRFLHVLDPFSGEILSSVEMGGYAGTAPLVANGVVYFGTASGDFLAFRGTLRAEAADLQ